MVTLEHKVGLLLFAVCGYWYLKSTNDFNSFNQFLKVTARNAWSKNNETVLVEKAESLADTETRRKKDETNSYKENAIIYLVRNSEKSIRDLKKSLTLLQQNLPSAEKYPIILFHEDNFTSDVMTDVLSVFGEVRNNSTQTLPMLNISFVYANLSRPANWTRGKRMGSHNDGYRNMIYFWMKKLFDHPRIRNLQFYLRLDTDSFIRSRVPYDFFEEMAQNHLKYGYLISFFDGDEVTTGLSSHAVLCERSLPVRMRNPQLYYNNFELVHVPTFRDDPCIRDFVDAIDRTGHIFNRRWGDAPLRFYETQLCLDVDKEVKKFCGFNYYHQKRETNC